jgi:predicted ATPase
MKVTVRNLGAINNAEIDIKPLTILVGPNNAGKTWLAYALAGIFGEYGLEQHTDAYVARDTGVKYRVLDNAVQQVLDGGGAKIDLVEFADKYGEAYFNDLADFSQHWMHLFISSKRTRFSKFGDKLANLQIDVVLGETKAHFLAQVLQHSLARNIVVGQGKQSPLLSVLKEAGQREMFVYTTTEGTTVEEGNITGRLPLRAIQKMVVGSVFETLHSALYPSVYTFPTERAAFITLPYVELAGKKLGIEPVQQFMRMVVELFQSSFSARESEANKDTAIAPYIQLAQFLETHILSGSVNFSTLEPENRREILFQQAGGVTVEIPTASSMVKELSPLVLYLYYLAKSGDWLIIDEPEMNLHPEAQARLTEFLAMLVQAGIRVLVTTHSPFIVDHLANLMKAAEHTDAESRETIRQEFFLQRTEAFIPKQDVSVYLVDNGTATNILGEDGLIHWDTFSDVSDKVTQIYFKL